MANSVGIIDSGYRGHLMAKVDVKDTNPENEYKIEVGNRLFQICSHNLLPFKDIIIVDKNHPKVNKNRTERGEGGFGSSGGVELRICNIFCVAGHLLLKLVI